MRTNVQPATGPATWANQPYPAAEQSNHLWQKPTVAETATFTSLTAAVNRLNSTVSDIPSLQHLQLDPREVLTLNPAERMQVLDYLQTMVESYTLSPEEQFEIQGNGGSNVSVIKDLQRQLTTSLLELCLKKAKVDLLSVDGEQIIESIRQAAYLFKHWQKPTGSVEFDQQLSNIEQKLLKYLKRQLLTDLLESAAFSPAMAGEIMRQAKLDNQGWDQHQITSLSKLVRGYSLRPRTFPEYHAGIRDLVQMNDYSRRAISATDPNWAFEERELVEYYNNKRLQFILEARPDIFNKMIENHQVIIEVSPAKSREAISTGEIFIRLWEPKYNCEHSPPIPYWTAHNYSVPAIDTETLQYLQRQVKELQAKGLDANQAYASVYNQIRPWFTMIIDRLEGVSNDRGSMLEEWDFGSATELPIDGFLLDQINNLRPEYQTLKHMRFAKFSDLNEIIRAVNPELTCGTAAIEASSHYLNQTVEEIIDGSAGVLAQVITNLNDRNATIKDGERLSTLINVAANHCALRRNEGAGTGDSATGNLTAPTTINGETATSTEEEQLFGNPGLAAAQSGLYPQYIKTLNFNGSLGKTSSPLNYISFGSAGSCSTANTTIPFGEQSTEPTKKQHSYRILNKHGRVVDAEFTSKTSSRNGQLQTDYYFKQCPNCGSKRNMVLDQCGEKGCPSCKATVPYLMDRYNKAKGKQISQEPWGATNSNPPTKQETVQPSTLKKFGVSVLSFFTLGLVRST